MASMSGGRTLPASMWAMMPMFLYVSSGIVRSAHHNASQQRSDETVAWAGHVHERGGEGVGGRRVVRKTASPLLSAQTICRAPRLPKLTAPRHLGACNP